MGSYLIAVLAMVVLAVLWLGVQNAWRKSFPEASADPDVLAGRMGCSHCDCDKKDGSCERNAAH